MSLQDYVCLKSEILAAAPDVAKAFMFKIMLVIDDNVLEHLKEKEEKSEEV